MSQTAEDVFGVGIGLTLIPRQAKEDRKRKRMEGDSHIDTAEVIKKHKIGAQSQTANGLDRYSLSDQVSSSHSPPSPTDIARVPLTPVTPLTQAVLSKDRLLNTHKLPIKPSTRSARPLDRNYSVPALPSSTARPLRTSSGSTLPLTPHTSPYRLSDIPPPRDAVAGHDKHSFLDMRQRLENREAECDTLAGRLADVESQLQAAKRKEELLLRSSARSARQANDFARLQAEVEVERKRRKEAEGATQTAERRLSALQKEITAKDSIIEGFQKDGKDQTTKLAEAEGRIQSFAFQARTAFELAASWSQKAMELGAGVDGGQKDKPDMSKTRMADSGAETAKVLRQNLLEAKSELAKQRILHQDLTNRLTQSLADIKSRDEAITTHQASIKDLEASLTLSSSRIAALDRECDSQLAELATQLRLVSRLNADVDSAHRQRADRAAQCDRLGRLIEDLKSDLAASHHRAEWYKAEYKKRDADVVRSHAQICHLRQVQAQQDRTRTNFTLRAGSKKWRTPTQSMVLGFEGPANERKSDGGTASGSSGSVEEGLVGVRR